MDAEGSFCWYCAEPATTRDHVRSRSASRSGAGAITVPACEDCNCRILRNVPLHSDLERGRYVLQVLTAKLKQVARPAEWSPEELVELSPRLQQTVRAHRARFDTLLRRVDFARRQWRGKAI